MTQKLSITYNVMTLPSQRLIQAAFPALDRLSPKCRYQPSAGRRRKKNSVSRKTKGPLGSPAIAIAAYMLAALCLS